MKIEAVIWDFGGVFCGSPFEALADVARERDVDAHQYFQIIFGSYDRDTDHPWHRLERGEITLELAREDILELGQRDGIDADPFHFFMAMAKSGGGAAREDVVAFGKQLKADGLATALVTNNAAEFRDHWRNAIPIDELFHHVIDSSEVGLRKPDPEIFELALERLGARAESAVFLDDFQGNLDAAARLGIRGILVEPDYAPALETLRRLLG
ncbi:MAG: HAD family phosphatase [Deltaproteobacteria bacterium]|nr:HAD family phosphatase [Deltaproteobacteria bacterium]MBW2359606.1 HAD family phosphatase [Deltaproteobacteria bacterium]